MGFSRWSGLEVRPKETGNGEEGERLGFSIKPWGKPMVTYQPYSFEKRLSHAKLVNPTAASAA